MELGQIQSRACARGRHHNCSRPGCICQCHDIEHQSASAQQAATERAEALEREYMAEIPNEHRRVERLGVIKHLARVLFERLKDVS